MNYVFKILRSLKFNFIFISPWKLNVRTVYASSRAEWNSISQAETSTDQLFFAVAAVEARHVEVNVFERYSLFGWRNDLPATAADVCVMLIVALKTDRVVIRGIIRHILLTSELQVAVEAAKMFDVVVVAVSQCVLSYEN